MSSEVLCSSLWGGLLVTFPGLVCVCVCVCEARCYLVESQRLFELEFDVAEHRSIVGA